MNTWPCVFCQWSWCVYNIQLSRVWALLESTNCAWKREIFTGPLHLFSPFRYLTVAFNFLTTLTKFNRTQKGCKCCGKKNLCLPSYKSSVAVGTVACRKVTWKGQWALFPAAIYTPHYCHVTQDSPRPCRSVLCLMGMWARGCVHGMQADRRQVSRMHSLKHIASLFSTFSNWENGTSLMLFQTKSGRGM